MPEHVELRAAWLQLAPDEANVAAGYLVAADADENRREAAHSTVGKR